MRKDLWFNFFILESSSMKPKEWNDNTPKVIHIQTHAGPNQFTTPHAMVFYMTPQQPNLDRKESKIWWVNKAQKLLSNEETFLNDSVLWSVNDKIRLVSRQQSKSEE